MEASNTLEITSEAHWAKPFYGEISVLGLRHLNLD
jgi:hypothetical protein